jgi:hypothetical protein
MMFNLFRNALYRKEVVPKDRQFVDQMKKAKMEMDWRWTVAVGHDDVLCAGLLGWIAKEQYHATACRPITPRNILMTKDEIDAAGFSPVRGQMPEWLRDPSVTGAGMLLTTGNDHLKKLERYGKEKRKMNRLEWM